MIGNVIRQKILIRGGLVVTLDPEDRILTSADVLIEDGIITAVGSVGRDVDAGCDRVIDATDRLLMPGLVNAHTHSPLSVVHGAFDPSRIDVAVPGLYGEPDVARSICQHDAELYRDAADRDDRDSRPLSRTGFRPRRRDSRCRGLP